MIKPAAPNNTTSQLIEANAQNWGTTTVMILRDHYTDSRANDLAILSHFSGDLQLNFEIASKWAKRQLGRRLAQTTLDGVWSRILSSVQSSDSGSQQPQPRPPQPEAGHNLRDSDIQTDDGDIVAPPATSVTRLRTAPPTAPDDPTGEAFADPPASQPHTTTPSTSTRVDRGTSTDDLAARLLSPPPPPPIETGDWPTESSSTTRRTTVTTAQVHAVADDDSIDILTSAPQQGTSPSPSLSPFPSPPPSPGSSPLSILLSPPPDSSPELPIIAPPLPQRSIRRFHTASGSPNRAPRSPSRATTAPLSSPLHRPPSPPTKRRRSRSEAEEEEEEEGFELLGDSSSLSAPAPSTRGNTVTASRNITNSIQTQLQFTPQASQTTSPGAAQWPIRHTMTKRKFIDWGLTPKKPWLIMGDSNLSRVTPYQLKELQIDSYPGANFKHAESILYKTTVTREVKKVILAFGLNNRTQAHTTSVKQLQAAVRAARLAFPQAIVLVPQIHFSTGLPQAEQANLDLLNRYIASHQQYIPLLQKRITFTEDAIHWTPRTAQRLLRHWVDYLNW